jgi:hypothetical protein
MKPTFYSNLKLPVEELILERYLRKRIGPMYNKVILKKIDNKETKVSRTPKFVFNE